MKCAFCHQPIGTKPGWKGTSDRYYCSEFCADSENVLPLRQQRPEVQKDRIDRQYIQRLERLLQFRQARGAGFSTGR
jgi:hypothetical protein